MGSLLLQLLPVGLGIIISPLAIVAGIVVLGSRRARVNSVAYLIGWVAGIAVSIVVSLWIFHLLEINARRDPPAWLTVVHFLLAAVLIVLAVLVLSRQKAAVTRMAAASTPREVVKAAPSLPGWLRAIDEFTPIRTGLTGFGLFVLNPVDLSCAIAGALTLSLADVSPAAQLTATIIFVVVSSASILVPVSYLVLRGSRAEPALHRLRDWVTGHTGVMNALLLLVIAALQLVKGLQSL
ncbi:GAP family protein [Cumulibacter soli]|uniref:GAP family protein n=1 Tax=Cumulibacter soli TaxID=2546344 RepID=UPI0010676153|nr:GAP family protein [Cumulibacter soli]